MGELIVIFLVALLLFGAKRLPEIGSSLGKGIREFKGSIREIEREIKIPDEQKGRFSPPVDDGGEEGVQEGEPRRLTSSPVRDDSGDGENRGIENPVDRAARNKSD